VLARIRQAHGATPEARIGLVAAGWPADMLAMIGWTAWRPRKTGQMPLIAVLRSWEERFGARLIDVGIADLWLLVERPPRTLEAAQRVAAERVVLADDCIEGHGMCPHSDPAGERPHLDFLVGLNQRQPGKRLCAVPGASLHIRPVTRFLSRCSR
jgi:hypothetical protein